MRKTRGVISKKLILQIEPIAALEDGTPIYPIMGSEDDPQEGGDGDDDDGEDGDDDGDGDDDDKDDKSKSKSKPKPKAKETDAQKIRRLNAENRERRLALEAAEKKIRDAEDADKSELEIAKRDLAELQAKFDKVPETMNDLRIENAFLKLGGYNWHDPEIAIGLIRKEVDISDDGEVEGLEDAVKALAKSKPYLLKKKDEEGDGSDDDKDKGRRPPRGPSGARMGGPKSPRGDQKAQREADLKKKYKLF